MLREFIRYALSRESVTVLQEATGGLYGWQHPGLPDNLCLYRGDGSPWRTRLASTGPSTR